MNARRHEADECADWLRALGDDTRLAVVRRLLAGPCHVGALNDAVPVSQSLLSHHLRTLREAGLVTSCRDGKAVLYDLSPDLRDAAHAQAVDLGCCRLSFPQE